MVTEEQILAHEIRTPLSLVSGAAELLRGALDHAELPAEQRKLLGTIMSNSSRAIAVAEAFLLSAKLDSGGFEPQFSEVDVRKLLRETAQELRETSDVPIVVMDPGNPIMIVGDPGLLRQSLWNIINNACRYAGEDSDIMVSAEQGESNVVISVSDRGRGMSASESKQLFVPFRQFSVASERGLRRPTGAGLGMTITQRIVEMHGGRLLVDSIDGHGTTVLITLPRENLT